MRTLPLLLVLLAGFFVESAAAGEKSFFKSEGTLQVFAVNPANIKDSKIWSSRSRCRKLKKAKEIYFRTSDKMDGDEKAAALKKVETYNKKCMIKSVREIRQAFKAMKRRLRKQLTGKFDVQLTSYPYREDVENLGAFVNPVVVRDDRKITLEELLELILKWYQAYQEKLKTAVDEELNSFEKPEAKPGDLDDLSATPQGFSEVESEPLSIHFQTFLESVVGDEEGLVNPDPINNPVGSEKAKNVRIRLLFSHFYEFRPSKEDPSGKDIQIYLFLTDFDQKSESNLSPTYKKRSEPVLWNPNNYLYQGAVAAEMATIVRQFGRAVEER